MFRRRKPNTPQISRTAVSNDTRPIVSIDPVRFTPMPEIRPLTQGQKVQYIRQLDTGAEGIYAIRWQDASSSNLYLDIRSPNGIIGANQKITDEEFAKLAASSDKNKIKPDKIVIKTEDSPDAKMAAKKMALSLLNLPGNIESQLNKSILKETGFTLPAPGNSKVVITFSVKSRAPVEPIMTLELFKENSGNSFKPIQEYLDTYQQKLRAGVDAGFRVEESLRPEAIKIFTDIEDSANRLTTRLKSIITTVDQQRGTRPNNPDPVAEVLRKLKGQVDYAIQNKFRDELDSLRWQRWGLRNPLKEDQIVPGTKGKAGSGAQGELFKYSFQQDGKPGFEAVVKLENPDFPLNENAKFTGIPENNPQQSLRAVLAYKISEEFNLAIIPRTEFFVGTDDNGHPKLGQAQEFVKGGSVGQRQVAIIRSELDSGTVAEIVRLDTQFITGDKAQKDQAQKALAKIKYFPGPDGKYYSAPLLDPEFQKGLDEALSKQKNKQPLDDMEKKNLENFQKKDGIWYSAAMRPIAINYDQEIVQKGLSDLQIFDYIIGHADRNAGNWIYVKDAAGEITGVKGIDNDDSFGYKWQKEGTTGNPLEPKTPDVPPVVDLETAIKILKMDLSDPKILEGLSPKDPDEISATRVRLKHVQDRIIDRARNGGIAAFPRQANGDALLGELRVRVNGVNGDVLPPLKAWGAGVRGLHDETNSYLGKMIANAGENNIYAAPDNDQPFVRV